MSDNTTEVLKKYHEKNLKLLKELRKEGKEEIEIKEGEVN